MSFLFIFAISCQEVPEVSSKVVASEIDLGRLEMIPLLSEINIGYLLITEMV